MNFEIQPDFEIENEMIKYISLGPMIHACRDMAKEN